MFQCEIRTHIDFNSMQTSEYHIDQVITINLQKKVKECFCQHPHGLNFTILIGYIYVQEIPLTYPQWVAFAKN